MQRMLRPGGQLDEPATESISNKDRRSSPMSLTRHYDCVES